MMETLSIPVQDELPYMPLDPYAQMVLEQIEMEYVARLERALGLAAEKEGEASNA